MKKKSQKTPNSSSEATSSLPEKPHGKVYRLFHNRWFLISSVSVITIMLISTWLIGSYTPPFPPSWIGVKYYSFSSDNEIKLEDVTSVAEDMKTVQTAILVFEPKTEDAKRLLPSQFTVNSFTLSDQEVLKIMLADSVARVLVGTKPEEQEIARAILADPLSAVSLKHIVVAVTQSNNISADEALFNEQLNQRGTELRPAEFDAIQDQIQLFAKISGAPMTESAESSSNLFTVEKPSAFRLYQNDEAKIATAGAFLREPYSDFSTINDQLVPLRAGRSPLLVLEPGIYQLEEDSSLSPITFHLAVQTVEGLPYNKKSVGHGWTTLAQKENGVMYPLLTMSLFNSLDLNNTQDIDAGTFTNIATYTNLGINHPDDWVRATKSLNYIPLPDGPSRSRVNEISPEMTRKLLLLRGWYLPQYSTQEYYMKYLQESLAATSDPMNKLALGISILHVKYQNLMNKTFWGTIQMLMNGTTGDTRYNGITSNCVAYSTDLWNVRNQAPYYDPRMLKLVAVPGKLFHEMNPEEVIDLPDAETLPPDQQNVPYLPAM